jgi:hypothetical protein
VLEHPWMRSGCKLDCNRLGDQKLRLTSGFHRSLSLMIKGLGLRAAQELCSFAPSGSNSPKLVSHVINDSLE